MNGYKRIRGIKYVTMSWKSATTFIMLRKIRRMIQNHNVLLYLESQKELKMKLETFNVYRQSYSCSKNYYE